MDPELKKAREQARLQIALESAIDDDDEGEVQLLIQEGVMPLDLHVQRAATSNTPIFEWLLDEGGPLNLDAVDAFLFSHSIANPEWVGDQWFWTRLERMAATLPLSTLSDDERATVFGTVLLTGHTMLLDFFEAHGLVLPSAPENREAILETLLCFPSPEANSTPTTEVSVLKTSLDNIRACLQWLDSRGMPLVLTPGRTGIEEDEAFDHWPDPSRTKAVAVFREAQASQAARVLDGQLPESAHTVRRRTL
jgi:hypothetical protein